MKGQARVALMTRAVHGQSLANSSEPSMTIPNPPTPIVHCDDVMEMTSSLLKALHSRTFRVTQYQPMRTDPILLNDSPHVPCALSKTMVMSYTAVNRTPCNSALHAKFPIEASFLNTWDGTCNRKFARIPWRLNLTCWWQFERA